MIRVALAGAGVINRNACTSPVHPELLARSMVLAQLFIVSGIGGMLNEAGMDVSTARLLALLVVIMAIGLSFVPPPDSGR